MTHDDACRRGAEPDPITALLQGATAGDVGAITALLQGATAGDVGAIDKLFGLVYQELKQLASRQRSVWQGDYTLNTTALVHEAYVKLAGSRAVSWQNRSHFFAVASTAMRHVLVNYAERRRAEKRGGGAVPVSLHRINPVGPEIAEEVIALNEALDRLRRIDERQVRVVECRFFAGLAIPDTAAALGVSAATVKRDWTLASAWLRRELTTDADQGRSMG